MTTRKRARRHIDETKTHAFARRLPRRQRRARPGRRQMVGARRHAARRRADALQRIAALDRRHFAAHADADVARARTRRPGHAHGVSDHSAAGRLCADPARPRSAEAGFGARRLGDPQSAENRPRPRAVRRQLRGERQAADTPPRDADRACPSRSQKPRSSNRKQTANVLASSRGETPCVFITTATPT